MSVVISIHWLRNEYSSDMTVAAVFLYDLLIRIAYVTKAIVAIWHFAHRQRSNRHFFIIWVFGYYRRWKFRKMPNKTKIQFELIFNFYAGWILRWVETNRKATRINSFIRIYWFRLNACKVEIKFNAKLTTLVLVKRSVYSTKPTKFENYYHWISVHNFSLRHGK